MHHDFQSITLLAFSGSNTIRLATGIAACLFLLAPTANVSAEEAPTLILDSSTTHYEVGPHFSILEDPSKTLTIDDVSGGDAARNFEPNTENRQNFGWTHSAFWFRITIRNEQRQERKLALYMPRAWVDSIEFFEMSPGGGYRYGKAGDSYPFAQWSVEHASPAFWLNFDPGETKTVYLRAHDTDHLGLPFMLMTEEAFEEYKLFFITFMAVFIAVAITMIFYNALVYVGLRDSSYSIYVLYITSMLLFVLLLKGIAFEYFWPEWLWWNDRFGHLMGSFVQITGVLFAQRFLSTATQTPRFDKALSAFVYFHLIYLPFIYILPYHLVGFLTYLSPMIFILLLIGVGFIAVRQGNRSAWYFLLAFQFTLIGMAIFMFGLFGFLTYGFLEDNVMEAGFLIEIILLSLALADRINTIRAEKVLAQANALEKESLLKQTLVKAKEELEIKVAERTSELKAAKDAAENATELKDKFVSLVSHDLRSPIGSIQNMLHMVLKHDHYNLDEEGKKDFILRAHDTSEGLAGLIDQLLDISMLKTGKIVPVRKFIGVRSLAEMRVRNLSHTAELKKVRIVNDLADDLRIFADQTLFGEVIHNLVSNAIKFSGEGDVITISGYSGDNGVTIAVKDTGAGIDKALLPDIFKQEVKTSTTGTAGEKGTGLGLPYCDDIMTAHGGTLRVESIPGEGSEFSAVLPEVKTLILIVDDQQAHRAMMKTLIGRITDADILEAKNGKEALDAIKERAPHLIVTDIQMPEINGLELLQIIKGNPLLATIPVIVTTSFSSSSDSGEIDIRGKALSLGADDFITKPVTANEFIPRVQKYLL